MPRSLATLLARIAIRRAEARARKAQARASIKAALALARERELAIKARRRARKTRTRARKARKRKTLARQRARLRPPKLPAPKLSTVVERYEAVRSRAEDLEAARLAHARSGLAHQLPEAAPVVAARLAHLEASRPSSIDPKRFRSSKTALELAEAAYLAAELAARARLPDGPTVKEAARAHREASRLPLDQAAWQATRAELEAARALDDARKLAAPLDVLRPPRSRPKAPAPRDPELAARRDAAVAAFNARLRGQGS